MWLATSFLPHLTYVIRILDGLNHEIMNVKQSENQLLKHESNAWRESDFLLNNVMKRLYTGDQDNLDAQLGFEFEAKRSFSICALGRAVNPKANNGQLQVSHSVQLWDCNSQKCIARINVDNSCARDKFGYAFKKLPKLVPIVKSCKYR